MIQHNYLSNCTLEERRDQGKFLRNLCTFLDFRFWTTANRCRMKLLFFVFIFVFVFFQPEFENLWVHESKTGFFSGCLRALNVLVCFGCVQNGKYNTQCFLDTFGN